MIERSEGVKLIIGALHKVQGELRGVTKDARNPHFKNTYASLEAVIEAAKPALQSNELTFVQAPGAINDKGLEVTTTIFHSSGEWISSTLTVPLAKQDAQGVGSAITYACRYSLMAMLGLPPVDDDGESAKVADKPKLNAQESIRVAHQWMGKFKAAKTIVELEAIKANPAFKSTYADMHEPHKEQIAMAFGDRKAELEGA